ncbi:MAG: tRNA (guanosine(37)-N1)-methyltransferase TrmD [Lachnospiraceae bacterium]|nr:tRNA (guanosine(37)-N1)-methyltransferase TrmD [Lachnospiraceae bacterium]
MRFHVMTLFPDMIMNALGESITGRAMAKDLFSVNAVNMRDFANNKYNHVDDYTYGGGAGMLIQPGPVYDAYMSIRENIEKCSGKSKKPRVVYMTPTGKTFDQAMAQEFAREEDLVILCGHYEGIDERVIEEIVTDNVSIGDFVLTGGELPAIMIIDAVSRLIPGVLGSDESAVYESFYDGLLEYPQYTRPPVFMGKEVPEVLLSGHHQNIEYWRLEQALIRTKERRPDLYKTYVENNKSKLEKLIKKGKIKLEL